MSGTGPDARERFSATADDYVRHRPGYPAALVDWVIETAGLAPGAAVADLGCGTGISTRLFAARGLAVVGIDPNEAMLAHARREGGPARYARGEAAASGLAAGSVDLVISGQAFHWFELGPTFREIARILRPGGRCAAFWNTRAATPLLAEYDALLARHVEGYDARPEAARTIAALRAAPEVREAREAEFENVQMLDAEGLLGRARSSSYVAHGVARRAEFERDLAALFARHERGGRVEFRYRTVAISWRAA
jgi:SAM-dependent methyltransferase